MTSISDTEVVNAPGGLVELGYAIAADSTTTATSAATGTNLATVTIVSDGSPILIEWTVGVVSPPVVSSGLLNFALFIDGSSVRDYWGSVRNDPQGSNYLDNTLKLVHRATLSAGTHTILVKAFVSSGTGIIHSGGLYADAMLRVSKIIQASQLLVTQSNAPLVTQLPSGNLVDGQRVDLYANNVVYPERWNASNSSWNFVGAPNIQQGVSNTSQTYSTASTWQNTNLSVSITPSSTTSRIMLNMSAFLSTSAAGVLGEWRIIRNSTTVVSPNRAGPATGQTINGLIPDFNTNRGLNGIPFVTLDSPASTSAQTYTLQVYPNGAISIYLNRWGLDANWGATSSIIAQEIPA